MAPYSQNTRTNHTKSQYHQQVRSNYYHQPQPTPEQASPQPQRASRPAVTPPPARSKSRPAKPVPRQRASQGSPRRSSQPQTAPPLAPATLSPVPVPATYPVRPRRQKPGTYVWAGGSVMLALMAFLLPHSAKDTDAQKAEVCQQQVQAASFLSRDELSQLLSVPERSNKAAVRQVIAEPYCLMSPVEVRQGTEAEREAYPLEFDPQTWVVVLYEGDEYAGYDFSFRH